MKKFFLYATAFLLISCGLSSCLKNNDPDPVLAGYNLYDVAVSQNAYTTAFAIRAIWLNALMVEAGNMTDLNNVKSADGKIDYKDNLFGSATITNNNGLVTINYPTSTGFYGDLYIQTNNKMLHESGALWTISTSDESSTKFRILVNESSNTWLTVDPCDYTVSRQADQWVININGFSCYEATMPSYKSNWDVDFYYKPYSMDYPNYENTIQKNRQIMVNSVASGKPIGATTYDFEYSVTSTLTYDPSCNYNLIASGKEYVNSPQLTVDAPKTFPAPDVTVSRTSANCNRTTTITYNGVTKNI